MNVDAYPESQLRTAEGRADAATKVCLSPDTTAPSSCEVALGITTIGETVTAGAFTTIMVAAAGGN
jgi:hypothetical protein